MICDPGYESCDEYRAQIASLTAEVAEWKQAAQVEAGLRREFLARASSAEAQVEKLRAALERADGEAERGQNGSAAHAQGQLTAIRIILRAALQSTEGDGR